MAKPNLIYLLSPSYSGSTLLTLLLAQHPKIATIGELKATARGDVEKYKCSCGQNILECSFWKKLSKRCQESHIQFKVENFGTHFCSDNCLWSKILGAQVRGSTFELIRKLLLRHTPGLKSIFQTILNQNYFLSHDIAVIQDAEYFLDGSKDPNRLLYFLESGLWNVKVVKIYRDGRAQSNSQRSKFKFSGTFEDSAIEWKKTIRQMEIVSRYIPSSNLHTLKYETLCSYTDQTLSEIFDFLNLEKLLLDWNKLDLKSEENHILGNEMRTKDNIRISLDEKWKKQVSDAELRDFERIAGHVNREIGY